MRELRVSRGLSLMDACKLLDLGPAQVSGLETGRYNTDTKGWMEVAKKLGVPRKSFIDQVNEIEAKRPST